MRVPRTVRAQGHSGACVAEWGVGEKVRCVCVWGGGVNHILSLTGVRVEDEDSDTVESESLHNSLSPLQTTVHVIRAVM